MPVRVLHLAVHTTIRKYGNSDRYKQHGHPWFATNWFSFSFDYGQHHVIINMADPLLMRHRRLSSRFVVKGVRTRDIMARWQLCVVITAWARGDYGGVERIEWNRIVLRFEPFQSWCTRALKQSLCDPNSAIRLREPCSFAKVPDGGVERFHERRAGVKDYHQLWHVLK